MTNHDKLTSISKFISLVLRHQPEHIGLTLDSAGWADVSELLAKAAAAGRPIRPEVLREVVETNDKQRFAFSEDGRRIRANQGHSIDVELGLPPLEPPPQLYHGTATRFLDAILRDGLHKRARHHVHLSAELATATAVGQRHGRVVVLVVDAAGMRRQGHDFYRSANGVWLTDHVPPRYLSRLEPTDASR